MIGKRMTLILLVTVAAFVSAPVSAATKIAFVEVSKLLQESSKVKSVKEKIRKEFAHRDDELVSQQKQLKKLQDKLVRDGSIMSEAETKRLERDIVSRRRKLKNSQSEFQEDLALRQNEELNKLRKVIAEVIIDVAKKDGYDIVLESGVVWASDKINITDKVLKTLNR